MHFSASSSTHLWMSITSTYIGTNIGFCAEIQAERACLSDRWQGATWLSQRIVMMLEDGGQVFTASYRGRKYSDSEWCACQSVSWQNTLKASVHNRGIKCRVICGVKGKKHTDKHPHTYTFIPSPVILKSSLSAKCLNPMLTFSQSNPNTFTFQVKAWRTSFFLIRTLLWRHTRT